jgi:hypothetical protein
MQADIEEASNQQDVLIRLANAKEFLQEHPDEKPITVARIYALKPTTLYSSLSRPQTTGKRGGHNKVLLEHHIVALHQFIRALLAYGIQPTPRLVFNAICGLKRT